MNIIYIHRFIEPDNPDLEVGEEKKIEEVESLTVKYSGHNEGDCTDYNTQGTCHGNSGDKCIWDSVINECFNENPHSGTSFVDPITKDIWIFDKKKNENYNTNVYRISNEEQQDKWKNAEQFRTQIDHTPDTDVAIATLQMEIDFYPDIEGGTGATQDLAVSADITRDGREILIKTYHAAFYYYREPLQSITSALSKPPIIISEQLLDGDCALADSEGTTISWHPKGWGFYTTSEEFSWHDPNAGWFSAPIGFYPRMIGCGDEGDENYSPYVSMYRPTDVATDGSDLESWPEWDKFNCLHESIYSNKGHCIDENYKFGLSFDKNDIGTYINIQHLCNNIHVGDDEAQYHHGKYECFAAPDEFCVE